jgi:hypothetical protein
VEGKINKFEQIGVIFSQFSEKNKDKLIEMAKRLLTAQKKDTASIVASKNEVKVKGRCSRK